MKRAKINNIFYLLILIITSNTTIACFTSRKLSHETMTLTTTPENYLNRTTKNITLTEISSTKTCNKSLEPDKELFICYHDGKCRSQLVPLNVSHYERKVYCVCPQYFNGEDCKIDDSYIIGEGNFLIIFISLILGFVAICYCIYKAYNYKKASKQNAASTQIAKEIYNENQNGIDDTAAEILLNHNRSTNLTSNGLDTKTKSTTKEPLDRSLSNKTGDVIENLNKERANRTKSHQKESSTLEKSSSSKTNEKSKTRNSSTISKAKHSSAKNDRSSQLERKHSKNDVQTNSDDS